MNRIFVIFALLLAFVAQVHAQKEHYVDWYSLR